MADQFVARMTTTNLTEADVRRIAGREARKEGCWWPFICVVIVLYLTTWLAPDAAQEFACRAAAPWRAQGEFPRMNCDDYPLPTVKVD